MPRIAVVLIVAVVATCSCAKAQVRPSTPAAPPEIHPTTGESNSSNALPANASIDQILDALHDVGVGLKDFSANVSLTEKDDTGLSSTRTGNVVYQLNADGDARVRVTFDKLIEGDLARNEKIEYKLDKGWLADRNYRKKIEVNRQVLRPGEKINLLKLGEGPFPLPIGQEKQDVNRLFEVTQPAAAKDDNAGPPNSVHIKLKPKTGTPFAKKFASIDVWVDRTSHMPVRIDTLDANEGTSRSTELSNVRVNGGLNDDDFSLPKIDDQEWTRHDEPFSE